MRKIESHKVAGNELDIVVMDEPGSGGANHEYAAWIKAGPNTNVVLSQINFQNGPIPVNGINGVTHEVLLAVVQDRLKCFQAGPFPCEENKLALEYVTQALEVLKGRTRDRIKRAVEGQLKA
jgi:hypothetical protein